MRQLVDEGASVASIEYEIESFELDGEHKSALWLGACGHCDPVAELGGVNSVHCRSSDGRLLVDRLTALSG